jgi:sugar lactone lactonase YvrE
MKSSIKTFNNNIFLLLVILFLAEGCTVESLNAPVPVKDTITKVPPVTKPDTIVTLPTAPKPDSIGHTTTFAGTGNFGYADGKADRAMFNNPNGLAIDAQGYLYVADQANNMIRKISPDGMVSTLAGHLTPGHDNGQGTAASFDNPFGLAIDASNNVFVADFGNNLIRKITPGGLVTTWAGSGKAGFDDAVGTNATFNGITGLTFDHNGNLYATDSHNLIRKITPDRKVTTIAGIVHNVGVGFANGTGQHANFYFPYGMVADPLNNIYIADRGNNMIRKITPDTVVTTFAGQLTPGNAYGKAEAAQFYNPS